MAPLKLQVWRIEKFEMVSVPKAMWGNFYSGDSYIVMNEKKDTLGNVAYDLHMWIGKDSTQDEYGACAIQATMLDDKYKGLPVQHRETQGYESTLFMGYFKPAIKYLEGGQASGFTHAVPNDFSAIKRLLWVRGRRQVRADVVPMNWSSLNKSDCFIVDMGTAIYIWNGPKSNRFERIQATNVANSIRDDERGGRGKVTQLSSDHARLEEFLGKYPGSIAEGEPEPSRGAASSTLGAERKCKLYRVSDDSGKMVVTQISDSLPFKQDMLDSGNVYITSNAATAQIFVWKGKGASPDERKAALKTADNFVAKEGLPKHTRVTIMAQFAEPALFRNMFTNWQDEDAQEGLGKVWSINKVAKIEMVDFDPSTLHSKPDMAAKYQLPDDGSGDVKVWRVEGSSKKLVSSSSHGQFYGGDCYIILYTSKPRGRKLALIYYWIGSKATADEVAALAILTPQVDAQECNGDATQIRVTQGKEPPHMLLIFGGKPLIVYQGGTSRSGGQSKAADTRLFHVKGGIMGRCRAVEVTAKAANLNSNDAFVLITPNGNYIWSGKGASEAEQKSCGDVAAALGAKSPTKEAEGSESGGFWSALGGKAKYATEPRLESETRPPRLFECSDASGNFKIEEVVGDCAQSDLNPDNVMLLDAWTALYIWIGKDSSSQEKQKAPEKAQEYLNLDPSERDNSTPIIKIQQGKEPLSFVGFFQGWDYDLWK